ncbi:MAG: hypothetical protein CVU41_17100 [Chloroflexi bacterium HGW-Chloroflexi-3]|nr:MAG: hypothetical protein CVU41_17100 [Chloroflexi bacterium HGW-Chloroflexi-3]
MEGQRFLDKLFPWLVWIVSLINAIWLMLIPGEKSGSFLNISFQRLILIGLILLPGIVLLLVRTKWGKALATRFAERISITISIISFWSLIGVVFFLLMPYARYRLELSQESWLRLLPVVVTYGLTALFWIGYKWMQLRSQFVPETMADSREVFIDFARGFAILLAVGSHAFYVFGYAVLFGDAMYQVMSFTRLATPSFILITGMMFELVYLRKAEKHGFKTMVQSLVSRAVQCYLAYGVTVLIEWFNTHLSTGDAQLAFIFLGNSLFSGILQFYTLFLLLAIPIIWLRRRFGIWLIMMLPVVVWLGEILLDRLAWPSPEQPLGHLTALLFGHPAVSNFSMWHALTFMAFGMLVGYMLKCSKQEGNWKSFQITLLRLFLICLVISLVTVLPTSWDMFFFDFSNTFRIHHELPYYSIGSMGAFLLLWITWKLRRFLAHSWLEHTVITLGRDSLWAFAVGNSLVAVLPALSTQTWYVVLFVALVLGGSIVVIKAKKLLNS